MWETISTIHEHVECECMIMLSLIAQLLDWWRMMTCVWLSDLSWRRHRDASWNCQLGCVKPWFWQLSFKKISVGFNPCFEYCNNTSVVLHLEESNNFDIDLEIVIALYCYVFMR